MGGRISIAEYSGYRISVLTARLNNFSGKTLSDLNRLGDAAPFRDQSWNVRAGAQESSPFQRSHSDANGYFVNLRQMHLSFHDHLQNAPHYTKLYPPRRDQ